MSLFRRRKSERVSEQMRDTLFGDLPPEAWPAEPTREEPWASFIEARRALDAGDRSAAIETWQRVAAARDLESRHYLQAWHFLRQVGVAPDDTFAKQLCGVVLEVPVDGGLDLLAAYRDRSARYYNHADAAVVWERPDDRLDPLIDALLDAGRTVVARIGPWEEERPGPPAPGQVRLDFLTPSGLHFGEGAFEGLASDPVGGPVITAGTALMQALTQLA